MEFEHITFDLPHGTFHALQGGDPDGQPTIVLHGFPDHPPTAKAFLAELGRRGRYVVAPWLRGYAPSPTAGPFDFAALTGDVLALIERWSPGRPVELIGHDWGALITYDVCVTAPERIERAVALAIPHPLTFMSRLTHPAQLFRSWYMGLFQLPGSGWLATAGDLALIDRLWRQWSPGFSLDPALKAELHEHLRASMPAPLKYYRAMLRPGMLGATRRMSQPIAVPLLQLHGANDGCILPAQVDDRHRFAARHAMEVVPDVGHFLHIEAPEAIAERIAAWGRVASVPPAPIKGALVKNQSAQGDGMTEQNAYQVADWNGQSGERWVANEARLDAMVAVFGRAAIDAAAPAAGERVLDVGCGAGASSLALAARVGAAGQVLGVDISEPLIGRARALAPQDAPVLFQLADAGSAELPEGAFDILFSRFGVMFFDDPTGAFAHMRRALRPGGRVAFVCWRGAAENDWVRLPMGALNGVVPPTAPPDPEAPGPFSFGDRGRVARILTAAGFTDIAIAPFDASVPFGEGGTREAALDDAVKMALEVGPLSRALVGQSGDIRARASAAVRAVFAALPGERSVMIAGAAWIVTARNPAS